MSDDIRMSVEMRTDYDCEATGFPAERWGEAVFTIAEEEIAIEVSVEEKITVAIMAGETGKEAVWKGTLEGLKKLLTGEIAGR
ncbi:MULTISPECIES: hypothetical protein [Desulfatibacillum]|jgi:hypothetical protein|uniref:Uncharacterized protein n=2 Tax=Desulfatibacillum TaxID=218207 RepID=B8FHR9_DESAL|nr:MULTISPECIES: hypothetical protein [Desulfatibacillum]ACL02486.1 hypothetical protein Dalk_0781 [Desulfatibacillum aliphaticivorans]SHK47189.1 hypothetical protein SAMN02745216_03505 [Desulfatibacillum alkenivorans DSM 16219]